MSFERKFGKDFLSSLPKAPGVYFFWDSAQKVIYIGKAKNLRRRISQYKNAKRLKVHAKMRLLIKEAHEITWAEFQTEVEAAESEISLIQQYRPPHNIASKFSFMYPYIGIRFKGRDLELLLTTIESELAGFQVFGAFRSNRKTREAFFSLVKLLQILFRNKSIRSSVSYTHRMLFEKVDGVFLESLQKFLHGKDESFLGDLTLRLVERAKARIRSEFVQESIDNLKKFFSREARRLNRVKVKTGFVGEFVTQEDRDVLFLKENL